MPAKLPPRDPSHEIFLPRLFLPSYTRFERVKEMLGSDVNGMNGLDVCIADFGFLETLVKKIGNDVLDGVNYSEPYLRRNLEQLERDRLFVCQKLIELSDFKYLKTHRFGCNNSTLHLACLTGQIPIIQKLLNGGLDPFLKNDLGYSPFDVCSSGIRTLLNRWVSLSDSPSILSQQLKMSGSLGTPTKPDPNFDPSRIQTDNTTPSIHLSVSSNSIPSLASPPQPPASSFIPIKSSNLKRSIEEISSSPPKFLEQKVKSKLNHATDSSSLPLPSTVSGLSSMNQPQTSSAPRSSLDTDTSTLPSINSSTLSLLTVDSISISPSISPSVTESFNVVMNVDRDEPENNLQEDNGSESNSTVSRLNSEIPDRVAKIHIDGG
ncbi:hypothetical protein BKA69DRAFT_529254 [Paraphysoderma sedebokerense]|nr:hypothetical protein BKA69DRAFT_529254 [Paraphysoderma sedebokerense]